MKSNASGSRLSLKVLRRPVMLATVAPAYLKSQFILESSNGTSISIASRQVLACDLLRKQHVDHFQLQR
jgi:hypothetical protein